MTPRLIKVTAAAASLAVFTSACENMTPGENAAVFGGVAALAVGIPLAVCGVDPSITIPVTMGAAALAAGSAYIIAKHQATERQRKIAEQRARLYMAKRNAETKKTASSSSSGSSSSSSKKAAQKDQPRYIAVKTEKEDFNKSATPVMVFDTQTNSIVGNTVYDVKTTPKVGSVQKFDTYSAQYIGG